MTITEEERNLAKTGMLAALKNGMDGVRVSLNKSVSETYTSRDGEIDRVGRCADRSLTFSLFAGGRFGTFSTNRMGEDAVRSFVADACGMVKLMEADPCRTLPQPERLADDARTGLEAGLMDPEYMKLPEKERMERARSMQLGRRKGDGWSVASEESECSDYIDETCLMDSQGFEGMHTETGFSCSSEVTVIGGDGQRYSSYWWDSSAFLANIRPEDCAGQALDRAVASMDPAPVKGGRYRMVVDGNVGSRLLSPIINALNASGIQQKMSFLCDSLGKRMFSGGLTLTDMARERGKAGARLFDSEGVATADRPMISEGVVENWFVNTYMANKTGLAATVEDISRPVLGSWSGGLSGTGLKSDGNVLTLEDILRGCGEGIYVTEFNGGNCNPVTGDCSFGVSGFRFSGGCLGRPFREMLITGNILELWNSLLAVGGDARECGRWRIPTTAFDDVVFSA